MTQPSSIAQLMKELQADLPHLPPEDCNKIKAFLIRARTEVTVWKAESIINQSEESKAA